jgi:hypothetical protein
LTGRLLIKDSELIWRRFPSPERIFTEEALQSMARDLTTALQKTIKEQIQVNKPCPHSKQWWNGDLQVLKKKLNKLSNKIMKQRVVPNHLCHEARKTAAKEYRTAIILAKKKHWTDFLEEATDQNLWTFNCYLRDPIGDGGKSRIPALKVKDKNGTIKEVASNAKKAKVLHKIFSPLKPAESLVPRNVQYSCPLLPPPVISKDQIQRHIGFLSAYKASSSDGILNMVLQKSLDHIKDYLLEIYQAIIRLGSYVDAWGEFTTVVLRKPGKPNYEIPKVHRPIALLCTMAKILTAIVAEDILYLVEKETLLPTNYYGGRPGRMTTDAMHVLVNKVKTAWRQGKIVSILFLDVEATFSNAVTDRLLHNLQRRKIPEGYVHFVKQLLKGRRTQMKFDDFLSELIHIFNRIGQGNPLSMTLYILFNADLLELAWAPVEDALGFIDDALAMAEGNTLQDNIDTLASFMNRERGTFTLFRGAQLQLCHR